MANILIVYGSLTGNTQLVAEEISQKLSGAGHDVTIKNANESSFENIKEPEILVLGASTWDDGLLQYDFTDFLDDVKNDEPNLSDKKIAVFGCGDSSYEKYCEAVIIIEKEFAEMGAKQIIEGLKIDGFPQLEENAEKIDKWISELIKELA